MLSCADPCQRQANLHRLPTPGNRCGYFDSKEEAIAYCEQNGLAYRVFESNPPKRLIQGYADNFA